jgi:hypothetical protein
MVNAMMHNLRMTGQRIDSQCSQSSQQLQKAAGDSRIKEVEMPFNVPLFDCSIAAAGRQTVGDFH